MEDFFMGSRSKLKPRERKFLEEYAKCGNHADAYLAAGYKVKSREVARTCGSRLLRRLDESMDYREVLESVGLSDRRLATALDMLIDHKDARVRVQALALAAKCKGWQKDDQAPPQGVTIIIPRHFTSEIEGDAPIPVQAPMKPRQITD
jgi:hypothetical protein